jgi:hypothetical protein
LREGGRVELLLSGAGEAGFSTPGLEAPLATLKGAVQRLRSWRGAIGHYEPGYAAPADIVRMYRGTVEIVLQDLEVLSGQL